MGMFDQKVAYETVRIYYDMAPVVQKMDYAIL